VKKRLKKKNEKAQRRKIHKILDIVLDINGIEPRKGDLTGSLPTAFFEFSGHVGWVEIDIRNKGWGNSGSDFHLRAHTYRSETLSNMICRMNDYTAENGLIK